MGHPEHSLTLFQGPGSPKVSGSKDQRSTKGRSKSNSQESRRGVSRNSAVIPSHLRKRPVSDRGRPVPPENNSCFWCSTPFVGRVTVENHMRECPSRTHHIKSCRGCHKEFHVSRNPPFMSEEYVRHICHCPHLRCRKCDRDNHHDLMLCPKANCVCQTGFPRCTNGHLRGMCDYDTRLPGWLRNQH